MQRPGKDDMLAATVMIILCFLHVIGIIISFIDFRASVINFQKAEEKAEREKTETFSQESKRQLTEEAQ